MKTVYNQLLKSPDDFIHSEGINSLAMDGKPGRKWLVGVLLLTCFQQTAFAQTQRFTLDEVIELAKNQSISAKRAATQKQTNYWQYRTFLSDYKPQLSLTGSLPSFTRSFVQVQQPDGTIAFQSISNNNSILNLSLSQNIALTGGTIFVQKQLQRFDDFERQNTLYNGIPFGIGLSQPLFRFNPLKWNRKTEPLRYEEGNQQAVEAMERVALNATSLYFDLLVAQVNLQIAEVNRANNDTLFRVARQKRTMGRLSQNDFLQLQLGFLTAKKDLASAQQATEVASLKLRMFVGSRDGQHLELVVPGAGAVVDVALKKAIAEAFANRSDAIAFRRRTLEAERDVDRAVKENGFNASLNASFGLSNRGARLADVYVRPQDREFVELQFTLPLMTWGRNQARAETARANQKLTAQTVEQDKLTFEQEIYTQVTLLAMLRQQVALAAEADSIAQERYQIAQNRFILSDLSVTDLGIATQEKDRARRDAILALRDYWQAYYSLRLLTLYDFETNQKIKS